MGIYAQFLLSMKLTGDDFVVDMAVIKEGMQVLTVSENGYGKRSEVEDYRLQSRSGKGIKAGVFNSKTGKLVNLKLIDPDNDVILITDDGVVIRVKAMEISKIGRDTLGVRIMKMRGANAKVVSVSTTPEEAEDLQSDDQAATEEI